MPDERANAHVKKCRAAEAPPHNHSPLSLEEAVAFYGVAKYNIPEHIVCAGNRKYRASGVIKVFVVVMKDDMRIQNIDWNSSSGTHFVLLQLSGLHHGGIRLACFLLFHQHAASSGVA